jgi:hypothetical protein
VLIRVLRVESPALEARGLELRLGLSEPVLLPARPAELYRRLRALLRAAMAEARPGPAKLAVLDLRGKANVEVTLAFTAEHGRRVLACDFPRHDPGLLARGFAEHLGLADG